MEGMQPVDLDELTKRVIGAAIEVHREIGPGLLESSYEVCLARELADQGIRFRKQVDLPIQYKGRAVDAMYRIDFLVEELVILELKAVERLQPIHTAQLMTYMRLARKPVGLILNFQAVKLYEGIVRQVFSEFLPSSATSASLRCK